MTEERWVYVGVRESNKGKRLFSWAKSVLDVDLKKAPRIEEDAEPAYFTGRKNIQPGRAGSVYRIEVHTSDEKQSFGKGTYEGTWPHKDQVVEWQTISTAATADLAARSKTYKAYSQNWIFTALDPLRMVYAKSSTKRRRQILAIIMERVTGG